MNLEGTLKEIKIVPEKTDSKGVEKQPKLVRLTFETEFGNMSDEDYGNLALTQAHGNLIGMALDIKQLLMSIAHESTTPVEE